MLRGAQRSASMHLIRGSRWFQIVNVRLASPPARCSTRVPGDALTPAVAGRRSGPLRLHACNEARAIGTRCGHEQLRYDRSARRTRVELRRVVQIETTSLGLWGVHGNAHRATVAWASWSLKKRCLNLSRRSPPMSRECRRGDSLRSTKCRLPRPPAGFLHRSWLAPLSGAE